MYLFFVPVSSTKCYVCDRLSEHKISDPLANCTIKNCKSGEGCFDGLVKTNLQPPGGKVVVGYAYLKACVDQKKCTDSKEQVCKDSKYVKKECLKYRCCDEDLCNYGSKPDIFAGFVVFVLVSVVIQAVFYM